MIGLGAIRERQHLFIVEVRQKCVNFRRDAARIAVLVFSTACIPLTIGSISAFLLLGELVHLSNTFGRMDLVTENIHTYIVLSQFIGGVFATSAVPLAYKFFNKSSMSRWAFWKEVVPVRDGEFETAETCGVCHVVETKKKWKHESGGGCTLHFCKPCVIKWLNKNRKTNCPQCYSRLSISGGPIK